MDADRELDERARPLALALKRPPARPLSRGFADRVVAAALAQALPEPDPGPLTRLLDFIFRPRLVMFRPGWALAAAAVVLAAGIGANHRLSAPRQVAPNVLVRFAVRAPGAETVSLAGDFNGWETEDIRLADPEGDGIWQAVVPLTPGVYQYMFVLNGQTWIPDPLAGERIDDGFGQQNSLVRVATAQPKGGQYRAL